MDLWIRSQDKKRLSKIKDIYIADTDEDVAICGYSSDESDDFDLGIYHTIKRALEVLDEIQRLLMPNAKLISNKDFEGNDVKVYGVEYIGSYVYEMPKE